MALDIFSSFDDHNNVFLNWSYLVWIIIFFTTLSYLDYNNHIINQLTAFNLILLNTANNLNNQTNIAQIGGASSIVTVLILTLIIMNLQGLLPYTFSLTSHLAINLAIALPIWTAIVIISITYDLTAFLAHLQPIGSPAPLNPFLCIIELVSILVRPLTLTVRITANLSTGHIIVGLLGTSFASSSALLPLLILLLGSFYLVFEVAVCVVQSYIFTLLPTLYGDEHPAH